MIGHTVLGSGRQKVLVLHGWFGDCSVFEPMHYCLDQSRFTYAFMDFRGYGKSKNIAGNYSISEIAGDAMSLAESLGWSKFDLVGHSLGGMVAQWIVANHPARIGRTVALTPVPAAGIPLNEQEYAMYKGAAGDAGKMGAFIHYSVGGRYTAHWERAMGEKCIETTTSAAWVGYLDALTKTNFVDKVVGCKAALKVVVCDADVVITEPIIRATIGEWFPEAQIEVLRNSGHYPMMEIPIQTATVIEGFLSHDE